MAPSWARFLWAAHQEVYCPSIVILNLKYTTRWYKIDIGEVGLDHFFEGFVEAFSKMVDPLARKRGTELVGL